MNSSWLPHRKQHILLALEGIWNFTMQKFVQNSQKRMEFPLTDWAWAKFQAELLEVSKLLKYSKLNLN